MEPAFGKECHRVIAVQRLQFLIILDKCSRRLTSQRSNNMRKHSHSVLYESGGSILYCDPVVSSIHENVFNRSGDADGLPGHKVQPQTPESLVLESFKEASEHKSYCGALGSW